MNEKGFSLVEAIIGITLFLILTLSIYGAYTSLINVVRISRLKISATFLSNEQFEIIRNLSYADVGILGGLPAGRIQQNQTISRDGAIFSVKTTIRNIDDPFDGTIGGSPNDLSPADYKLVELEISCSLCPNFSPLYFDTYVGPKSLEGASTNGALFVRVFDANGQPISQANVHIENNQAIPNFTIDDVTNNSGLLQVIDAPPGVEAYNITVSKQGYSQEKTYPTGGAGNLNPTKPNATVAVQQVTQISFAIDKTSVINVSTITETCSPVGNVSFSLTGSKLIGLDPNILKYSQYFITNDSGDTNINNLEWDTYNFILNDSGDYLIGAIPLIPLNLSPNVSQNLKLIVAPINPDALLVTVKDASAQLPLSGADVLLQKTGYSGALTTGRGFLNQTDWSGGAGQENFIDPLKYFDSDGNVDISNPAGELKLKKIGSVYNPSGYLISSTFDTGSASNFYQILWQPEDQPPETGQNPIKFQIATNNDKTTWNFLGPDGTANTFYTLSNTNINSIHNGNRYLRYKVFLQTANTNFTPNLGQMSFAFSSQCVPSGQVMFSGLDSGDYNLTVSKTGYQTFNGNISVSQPWQESQVILAP